MKIEGVTQSPVRQMQVWFDYHWLVIMCVSRHVTGGAPDMSAMTGGKFSSGMMGCVRNLRLLNTRPVQQEGQEINLQAHIARGINVQPCSS